MARPNEIPIAVLKEYFRVPAGNLPIDYRGRPVLSASFVTNISAHGVFVRTISPLPTGTEVLIRFRLPDSTVDLTATTLVRWSSAGSADSPDPTNPIGMGLEFTKISSRNRRLVEAFVEEFLQRMRR